MNVGEDDIDEVLLIGLSLVFLSREGRFSNAHKLSLITYWEPDFRGLGVEFRHTGPLWYQWQVVLASPFGSLSLGWAVMI